MRKNGKWLVAVLFASALLFAGCGNQQQSSAPGSGEEPAPSPTEHVLVPVIVNPPAGFTVSDSFTVQVNITSTYPLKKVEYKFDDGDWVQVYPSVEGASLSVQSYTFPISFVVDVPDDLPAGTYPLEVRATDEAGETKSVSTVVRVVREGEPAAPNLPEPVAEGVFNFSPSLQLDQYGYVVLSMDNRDGVRFLAQDIDGEVFSYPYVRGRIKVIVDPARAGYSNVTRVQLKVKTTTTGGGTLDMVVGDDHQAPFEFSLDTRPEGAYGKSFAEFEGEPLLLVAEIYTQGGGSYVVDAPIVIDNSAPDDLRPELLGAANDGKSRYLNNYCNTQEDWIRGTALFGFNNAEEVSDNPKNRYAAGIEGAYYALVDFDKLGDILSIRDDNVRAYTVLDLASAKQRVEWGAPAGATFKVDTLALGIQTGHYAVFTVTYDRLGNAKTSATFADIHVDNVAPTVDGQVLDVSPLPFEAAPGFLSDWINIQVSASDNDGGVGFSTNNEMGGPGTENAALSWTFGPYTDSKEFGACHVATLNFDFARDRLKTTIDPSIVDDKTGYEAGTVGYDTNGNTDLVAKDDLDYPEIPDGEYYLVITAADALGNTTVKKFGPYYVDNTDPKARVDVKGASHLDDSMSAVTEGGVYPVDVEAYDGFSGLRFLYVAMNDFVLGEQDRSTRNFAAPIEIYAHTFEANLNAPGDISFEQGFDWTAIDPGKYVNGDTPTWESGKLRLMAIAVDKAGNATLYWTPMLKVEHGTGGENYYPGIVQFDAARRDLGVNLAPALGIKGAAAPYAGEGNIATPWAVDALARLQATFAKPVNVVAGVIVNKVRWDAIVEWQLDAYVDDADQEDLVFDPTLTDDPSRRAQRRGETIYDNNSWLYPEAWQEVDAEASKYAGYLGTEETGADLTEGLAPFVYLYGGETQQESTYAVDLLPNSVARLFGGADAVGFYFDDNAHYNLVYEK